MAIMSMAGWSMMVSATGERQEHHLTVDSADQTAVDLLSVASKLPKQRIKRAMAQGAVWIGRDGSVRRLRRAKRQLRSGDELHLYYDEQILAEEPPPPTLIATSVVIPSGTSRAGPAIAGLKVGRSLYACTLGGTTSVPERTASPSIVSIALQRFDASRAFEKTAAALAKLFRERVVEKRYRALVHGDYSSQPAVLEITSPIDGKSAISRISFREVVEDGRYSRWM